MWTAHQRQRWLTRLPLSFDANDQQAGYWWEISMRRSRCPAPLSSTLPGMPAGFFEALVADNLDLGRPHNVETIFGRRGPPRHRRHLPHHDRPHPRT